METYRGEMGKKTWLVLNLSGEGAMGVKPGGREVLGEMRRTWSPCATKGLIFSFVHTLNQSPFDSSEFPPPFLLSPPMHLVELSFLPATGFLPS